jgi:hypothetical protein
MGRCAVTPVPLVCSLAPDLKTGVAGKFTESTAKQHFLMRNKGTFRGHPYFQEFLEVPFVCSNSRCGVEGGLGGFKQKPLFKSVALTNKQGNWNRQPVVTSRGPSSLSSMGGKSSLPNSPGLRPRSDGKTRSRLISATSQANRGSLLVVRYHASACRTRALIGSRAWLPPNIEVEFLARSRQGIELVGCENPWPTFHRGSHDVAIRGTTRDCGKAAAGKRLRPGKVVYVPIQKASWRKSEPNSLAGTALNGSPTAGFGIHARAASFRTIRVI